MIGSLEKRQKNDRQFRKKDRKMIGSLEKKDRIMIGSLGKKIEK